jgi:hypothetical protein
MWDDGDEGMRLWLCSHTSKSPSFLKKNKATSFDSSSTGAVYLVVIQGAADADRPPSVTFSGRDVLLVVLLNHTRPKICENKTDVSLCFWQAEARASSLII